MTATTVVVQSSSGPGFLVRAIWFLLIGWWLAGLVIGVGYLAAITIVGLPAAFYLFNRIPAVLTLRGRTRTLEGSTIGATSTLRESNIAQHPMWIRAVYFVLVGWWLGAIWLSVAYGLALIIITLPVALLMFNRTGAVMTLLRY